MTLLLLGAGRSSSSFSPSSIDGLSFWLDADGSYLLTEPSARDLEATNNEFFSVAAPATDYDLGTDDFGITLSVLRETAGTKQVICGKYLDGTNYWFLWIGTDNILRFQAVASGGIVVDITGTTALSSTSTWYTLGVIIDRDSSANTKLYVNGADDTSGTPSVRADDVTLNAAFEVGRGDFVEIGNLSLNVQTTGPSETFDLIHPLANATSVSFDVDWGDGNVDTGITSKTDPLLTHTYASADTYTINITGTLDDFRFDGGGDKDKVTAVNRVAGDTLGLSNAFAMFKSSSSITTIAPGCFDDCAGFTADGFYYTFWNCPALASIPSGLFDSCVNLTTNAFLQTFYNCEALTSIPANLFDNCTGVTTNAFYGTFQDCSGITGAIPAGLFDNNTLASFQAFNATFWNTGISSIPAGLFNNNTAVSTDGFSRTFQNTNITSIPSGLFDNAPNVNVFRWTFDGCSSLTSIPNNLFDNNTAVTSFNFCFNGCSSLTSIPSQLFRYNTAVTTFARVFQGCSGLTSIPASLFQYNTNVAANAFEFTFWNCTGLTTVPADLFRYNTGASTTAFSGTFYGCTGLTSIPTDLFRYNTAVSTTGFSRTFQNCSSLTTVPANVFLYNTSCTDFTDVFFNCALTQASVDNFLVSLDSAGQSNGTADCDGGTSSAPGTPGSTAISNLQGRGWTVTTN